MEPLFFFTSAPVWGEWWASRPRRLTPRERAPGTHWVESWWAPNPVWTIQRIENAWSYRDPNSDPSVVRPVLYCHYTDWATAILFILITLKNKLHGLSPRANYTDRATAACLRSDCQLFADRGFHVVSVTDPYGHILGFLDRSRYFFIK
jgi:hypothetical protein